MPAYYPPPVMSESENPYLVWFQRWQSLDTQLNDMVQKYGAAPFPRSDAIIQLAQELQTFGSELFHYFYAGFLNEVKQLDDHRISVNDKYPPAYIFRQILDQISFDIQIIQVAAAQRQNSSLQSPLEQADKLAQWALEPAIAAGLLPGQNNEGTTALTYFAQRMRARVIPYTSVALVSIPYAKAPDWRDLLSTAHEVGHYIYWNGDWKKPDTDKALNWMAGKITPLWLNRWAEEIFADVYGAWVTGLPIALSAQDILLDNLPELIRDNDHEHPVSYIRPFIYTQVLREALQPDDPLRAWLDRLDLRWIANRPDTSEDGFYTAKRGYKSITFTEARALMKDLVQKMVDTLKNPEIAIADGSWLADQLSALAPQTDEELAKQIYQRFQLFVETPLEIPFRQPIRRRNEETEALFAKQNWNDQDWQTAITYSGWVSRGPETNPNPPPWG